ncbi:MAG: hypothetical protein GWO41_07255 [candidate division Zixibacteria bacterium]|nr:hypothetical protein [Phycisphaerae bacterium]NIR63362.1 hypothetical protein [candidate division Zixibacteria bacterium]NIS45359.1 hypothetical protein [candidate division Zixibacteria bacterium]NIS53741.1 hypothetical protein [Phycisphaerae bacterium]NIT52525.1 hypothetical protein [candidate division Zixibacteria bacterium]
MRIGIINIEPKICNTAYMQLAGYHKRRGDTVEWWTPLTDRLFDRVYCSALFDFSDKSEVPKHAICGGTGFDVKSRLPVEIEYSSLDYSIYPNCMTTYLWFSRGCVRNCPWCVVPEKEGRIHPAVPRNLNPKGRYITVCDNNFFASHDWRKAITWLINCGQPVDFQGVDIRIITDEQCRALTKLRHYKRIKFAWDVPGDEEKILAGIDRLRRFVPLHKCMCYVLVGYNSTEEQDLHRIETLRGLGLDPFVMPFDKTELYQRTLARWVNHKAIFKKVKWSEYRKRVEEQETAGTGWVT